MANVNLTRQAEINYSAKAGDTFATPPVAFIIDGVDEDFSGSTIKVNIKGIDGIIKRTLTDTDGVTVSGNTLQYTISAADMVYLPEGIYNYDVQKTITAGSIVSTIQYGKITIINEFTT